LPSKAQVTTAQVIINARVATLPEILQAQVSDALTRVCQTIDAQIAEQQVQSFQPGRPVPTHRILEPVGQTS